jgi:hypothetical protein
MFSFQGPRGFLKEEEEEEEADKRQKKIFEK